MIKSGWADDKVSKNRPTIKKKVFIWDRTEQTLKHTYYRIKSHNKRSGSHTLSTHYTLWAAHSSVADPLSLPTRHHRPPDRSWGFFLLCVVFNCLSFSTVCKRVQPVFIVSIAQKENALNSCSHCIRFDANSWSVWSMAAFPVFPYGAELALLTAAPGLFPWVCTFREDRWAV